MLKDDLMVTVNKETTIITRSVKEIDFSGFMDGSKQPIDLDDIAHSLAKQHRYTGHAGEIDQHYSIAEHSVLVSRLVTTWAVRSGMSRKLIRHAALWGLFHDGAESMTGDLNRPLKLFIRKHTDIYDRISDMIDAQIVEQFDLHRNDIINALVKRADTAILKPEREALWKTKQFWTTDGAEDTSSVVVSCWSAREAKIRFLETYEMLKGDG